MNMMSCRIRHLCTLSASFVENRIFLHNRLSPKIPKANVVDLSCLQKSGNPGHLMALLLVSATMTVPSGPAQRPPGSDSHALAPLPSASPAVPLPATVLMLLLPGSSTCCKAQKSNCTGSPEMHHGCMSS